MPIGEDERRRRQPYTWGRMLGWTVVLTGGAFLLTRHASHVFQFLPFMFLFACPVMCVFYHHHRHHH